jgi:hypothetical protein
MIKELLNNEEVVKRLERFAKELDVIKKKETDFSYVVPMIIMSLELFRNTNTKFPINFFNKTKSINNGNEGNK